MKRSMVLLVVLGLILAGAGWYMLLWQPRVERLAGVEDEIVTVQATQETTRSRIAELEGVRDDAPQLQAELATADTLVPQDTALPSALRQLQLAADESGATLVSVNPARPVPVEGQGTNLYELNVSVELTGSYFQLVDTLRRLEDPTLSPRGYVWSNLQIVRDEEAYPVLSATLAGRMFAVLPSPSSPEAETPAGEDAGQDAGEDGGEAPADGDGGGTDADNGEEGVL